MSNWKEVNLIEIWIYFFLAQIWVQIFKLIHVSDNVLSVQWNLWWSEDYKSDSTSRCIIIAYSMQINYVHIINIFILRTEVLILRTPYILLVTVQKTWVYTEEFRHHVTWTRNAERLSTRKLKKCIHWGFYQMTFLKIRYIYPGGGMKYSRMFHGFLPNITYWSCWVWTPNWTKV